MIKQSRIVGAWALVGLLALNSASAADREPVTAKADFAVQITITENNALQFELIDQNFANTATISIGTNSVVTDAASHIVGGTQSAANCIVSATPAQTITILVDAIIDGTGYELTSVRCECNAGADTVCNGAGMSATFGASTILLVDATTMGDDFAATEVANISFDVTVAYH